ncbi:MAG: hypothetical protein A2X86_09580 [Bdellovibrionales bacterium GWA2_49_15]|nr:MAG: hypothetical protein A2X86_09580 [Bdellovibrionales bacterium GWA2_49_15]HAZ13030.1 hypothetical protein [Bdellovibrionales bacterium]
MKKFTVNFLVLSTILTSHPAQLLAAERTYEFCNKGPTEAQSFSAQATLAILDAVFSYEQQEIAKEQVEINADGKNLSVSGLKISKNTCLKAKIATKAMGGPIASYRFGVNGQETEIFYPSGFEGEEGTAVLADVIDLQNLNLQREAERALADGRLADCKTPEECIEAKKEVIEVSANAQAAERSLQHRLSDMKKYLIPAGAIALGALGGLLGKQVGHYRSYLKALREKETCARTGGNCSELEILAQKEKTELTKIGENVNGEWGTFVKDHGQGELRNPNPKVEIELPKYFEGSAPIANDNVVILANLNGLYPRDLRKIEMEVEGKKLPVQFLPNRGLVRIDLPDSGTHGEYKAKLRVYGDAGVIGEKSFSIKKDSTTPKVTISESGKSFAVKVSDAGLGFEGLTLSGSNVKIENPEINFDGKKTSYETKVKMIKRPASLEVKAHKSVVRQDVRSLSNGDQVLGTNAAEKLKYPEERTPILPGLSFDQLLEQIMNGRQVRGLCCRDSRCLFCYPDNLLSCRQAGFSHWKFTDGDPACYKIKPLP